MNKRIFTLFILFGTTSTYLASNEIETQSQETKREIEQPLENITQTSEEVKTYSKNGSIISFSLNLGDAKPSDSKPSNAKMIFRRGAKITTLSLATAALIHCYLNNEACLFLKACFGLGILNGFIEPVADTL
jgi:hypothetical protein